MLAQDANAQKIVDLNSRILGACDIYVKKDWTILDYGCGSGRHVYEYQDMGYSGIMGFDTTDYAVLRHPTDRDRFRFGSLGRDGRMAALPWPDNTFDFVFATSVFEHVLDQATAYAEIYRVLKPGGAFLNNFPAKWRPIEPHMYVPFGGATRAKWWFTLWAILGIRNQFGEGISRLERARRNHAYAVGGIHYLTGRQIDTLMRDAFDSYQYVEDVFVRYSPGRSRHLAGAFAASPILRRAFRLAHTRVILAGKSA